MLSFGQRLKKLRREADLSQADLAEAVGVSVHSVSKWECDSNMPDVSLLLPISAVLGVTSDCLLGAGTNEKEDQKEFEEEIRKLGPPNYYDYKMNLKRYEAAKAFLKKYPLNYKVKLDCIAYLGTLLYHSTWPKAYEISSDEFELLYEEGIRMIRNLIDHDTNPNRLILARKHLIVFLSMKEKWVEAEAVAMDFPDISNMRKGMLAEIAFQKKDFIRSLELFREICAESANEVINLLYIVGERTSDFGSEKKRETIEAWQDMKKITSAFADVFSKYSPKDHFTKVKWLLQAICMISSESIGTCDAEAALSSLEEATEIAVKAYREIKEAGADKELLDSAVKEFRAILLNCYNSVISDDNRLTCEERYRACKSKIDALENGG